MATTITRIQAKHVHVGNTLSFAIPLHNFRVDRIETRDAPYPQVRFYSQDEALTLIYGPNDSVDIIQVAQPASRITSTKDLTPGILYCLFVTDRDCNDQIWERDGALVYWTGREFIEEDGSPNHSEWDYAVAQSTAPNGNYIEDDWNEGCGGDATLNRNVP